MKIESKKFINIQKIVKYLGNDVATKLLQIHAVRGCDTVSFLHIVGKIKVLKNGLNGKEKLRLLNTIVVSCKVSDTRIKNAEKFFQTVCYSGKEEESFTETRVRLYKQMKTKTSHSLLPDEKLMLQAVKRVHYQVYYSSRVDEIISDILLQDNGWIADKENKMFVHYG